MKRRKPPIDNRLDWRDPNMPVLRLGYLHKKMINYEVHPDKIKAYYEQKMANHPAPDWKNDPSYNWRKKK